jgi:hypothetical protein
MHKISMRQLSGMMLGLLFSSTCTANDVVGVFPLNHYDQRVAAWIKPTDAGYNKSLLPQEIQQQHMNLFYEHLFGVLSPWDEAHIQKILRYAPPDDLATNVKSLAYIFNNAEKSTKEIGYGENFRPYNKAWLQTITENMNLAQFKEAQYQENNRGIAIDNLAARALPTDDAYFYSHKLAGEG